MCSQFSTTILKDVLVFPVVVSSGTTGTFGPSLAELPKDLVGLYGVHYFAAELVRNGLVPVVTSRNTQSIDVIVSNPSGSKAVALQVKTRREEDAFGVVSFGNEPASVEQGLKKISEKIAPSPANSTRSSEFRANLRLSIG